jgi:metallo-beta-lactamase class B
VKHLRYLLFSLCALPLAAQMDPSWTRPRDPVRILNNLYWVGTEDLASLLLTTPQGHILIDTGLKENVPQVEKNIARLGFRLKDVKILLNTQAHIDHAGGLAEVKRRSGAMLYASAADAALMARGGKGDFAFGDELGYEAVKADRILRDGEQVRLGELVLTAHLTPGHTQGCTTWTLRSGKLDVVVIGGVTAPGYRLVNNAKYPGILADFDRTFRTLRSLPVDVYLAGHASQFGLTKKAEAARAAGPGGTNPFVDRAGYLRFLDEAEKNVRTAAAKQRGR